MRMFFSSDVKLESIRENMKWGEEGFWINCNVYKTAGRTPWVVERRCSLGGSCQVPKIYTKVPNIYTIYTKGDR